VNALIAILTVALLGVVILFVSAPLRAVRRPPASDADAVADRAALSAAREAKYREIRDAELDYRTGKLSQADYETVDAALRSEAVAILDRLRELGADEDEDED
jgi:hypothetical protein